jgi:hypothetical protein
MTTPSTPKADPNPKTKPFTEEELRCWFKLDNYGQLRELPLSHWVKLLETRVLAAWLVGRTVGDVPANPILKHIALYPCSIAGEQYQQVLAHASDTPSVKHLRVAECELLARTSWVNRLPPDECFDLIEKTFELEGQFGDFAHLRIDLGATKAQLQEDFANWIDRCYELHAKKPTNRDYAEKVRSWAHQKYLPYFDLHLLSTAAGRPIPPKVMCDLLEMGNPNGADSDRLKSARKSLNVFNDKTLRAMRLQVRHDHR